MQHLDEAKGQAWAKLTREVLEQACGSWATAEEAALMRFLCERARMACDLDVSVDLGSLAGMLAIECGGDD